MYLEYHVILDALRGFTFISQKLFYYCGALLPLAFAWLSFETFYV